MRRIFFMTVHVNIGIPEKNRAAVCKFLQVLLSNEFLLYTKTLNYHWNVEGRQFHDFHEFFKEQYEQMLDIVDEVAERIRKLGHKSYGTMGQFLKVTTLEEHHADKMSDLEMIKDLLHAHEAIIQELRKDQDKAMELGDQGTNNFLISMIESHEKMAWMLRAHLVK